MIIDDNDDDHDDHKHADGLGGHDDHHEDVGDDHDKIVLLSNGKIVVSEYQT